MLDCFAVILLAAAPADQGPSRESEERLVQDVRALLADQAPRPSHVDVPVPGSFGDNADAYLRALQKRHDAFPRDTQAEAEFRQSVFAGERPLSALPEKWIAALNANRADVLGLLRATHAATGRLPHPLTLFGIFDGTKAPYGEGATQFAANLASVELVLRLERRQSGALSICADQLALARDVSHGTLIGQMVAAAIVGVVMPGCALAIQRASSSELAAFRLALRRIREGWTAMSTTMDQEIVFVDLVSLDVLSASTRAAIPPEARLVTATGTDAIGWTGSARRWMFGSWARESLVRNMSQIQAAMLLAPPEADALCERLERDQPIAMTLLGSNEDQGSNWVARVRRVRSTQARLAMLDAAAAVMQIRGAFRRWPATWAEVAPEPPTDPRTLLPLQLMSEGNAVRIVPQSSAPRTEDDLSLTLR